MVFCGLCAFGSLLMCGSRGTQPDSIRNQHLEDYDQEHHSIPSTHCHASGLGLAVFDWFTHLCRAHGRSLAALDAHCHIWHSNSSQLACLQNHHACLQNHHLCYQRSHHLCYQNLYMDSAAWLEGSMEPQHLVEPQSLAWRPMGIPTHLETTTYKASAAAAAAEENILRDSEKTQRFL